MGEGSSQSAIHVTTTNRQQHRYTGVLCRATTQPEIFNGIKDLIESNRIVGLFNEVLKNPLAIDFVQQGLTAAHKGEASELVWLLFILSYGTISDVPFLIEANKVSSSSLAPALINKLRKATILEYCLTHRIVDLRIFQRCLSIDGSETSLDTIMELLIELILDDVLDGKIDEEQECFYVSWVR